METQDHKSPIYSGNEGHGGVHVCRQCGWPFPNHHPSSKQRRAHKRVCGTIEGHRVIDNDALDETHMEGDVGDLNSDDELKTISEKVVERTISRRSSSGVGSKSNRSTRSEDDVFTDAGTEFNESSASVTTLTREASDGVMQRFYSMKIENELDDTEPAEENSAATDNLLTPDLLNNNKLQTVQKVEDENDKLETGAGPQDHISNSLVSAIALESEKAVDLNVVRSSEPSSMELDIAPKRDEMKGVSDEVLDPVASDGWMKTTLVETDGVEDISGRFNAVGAPEKGKFESCNEVNSSGYLDSPAIQAQDVVSDTKNIRKSDLTEECDVKIDSNENVNVLSVPDSKIAAGDLDHKGGNFNFPEDKDSMDVIGSDIDFTMIGDIDRVFSEDVDKQKDSTKFVDEHNAYQEPKQMSCANSAAADINILRNEVVEDSKSKISEEQGICTKGSQPITSVVNISPEGVAMDAGHIQETTLTGGLNVKDDEEHFTILDNDGGIVSGNDFAVKKPIFAKPDIDKDTLQDLELINTPNNSGMDDIDNTSEADILNGEHTSEGVAKSMTTEIRPVSGLEAGKSYDSTGYSTETEEIADQGALNKISESGDIITGHPQAESQLIMIESTGKNEQKEEHIDGNLTGGILINDNHYNVASNKLEVDEIAEHSCPSSAVATHCSNEKLTENTLCASEGDGVVEHHVSIPAIDTIVDSSSQTDSLDASWGSGSVMSTTSDAQPTADTIASNHPRALQGEEIPSMVPRPLMENQPSENQISAKAEVGIKQIESVSEMQTSKEQQHINTALQTGWTPTVAEVANGPDRGKKEKEIIAKVDNWDSAKQRSPLKTLLGEAIAKSRAESPVHHNQTDVAPGTNNGFSGKTENVIHNSDHPETEASHEETGKEWDSPAKYPVKIKTEKRSKSKAYWAPFLCCSSVNAR